MIGRTVSHYKITAQLGAGGMGVVYRATDLRLDRTVALKFLGPERLGDENAKRRFIQEARAASALDHPNICNVHEIDEAEDGQLFIAMACYEGETLHDRLASGPLDFEETREILRQVTRGLACAHERGIVHRDIKPSNIFLCRDGLVKLLDFGLSRQLGQAARTGTHRTVGTVHYMAPEQARGEALDHRADIWSLGVVLYVLLTGRKPFEGEDIIEVLRAIERAEPAPVRELRPDAPTDLVTMTERCLARDPAQRYPDLAELQLALGDTPTPPALGLEPTQIIPSRRRVPVLRTLTAVLALVAVVVLGRGLLVSGPPASVWILAPEMEDRTAAGDLGPALHDAMVIDLQQSRHVKVFGGRSLADAFQRMGRAPNSPLTEELATEVALREGIPLVLSSSVRAVGDGFVVTVRVTDAATGEVVHSDSAEAASRRELMDALDRLDRGVRERLGESASMIARSDEPLEKVTTPSLEALQLYTQGLRAGYNERGIALLKQAVEADPDFAMAYARLARILHYRANTKASLQYSQMAFDRRQHLTPRERLYIEGEYYRSRAQYPEAVEALVTLLELHPEAVDSRYDLIAIYLWMFQYHNALAELDKLDAPLEEQRNYAHIRGVALAGLGRWPEAERCFRQAIVRDGGPALTSRLCLSWALIGAGRLDAASAQADSMLALDRDRAVGADYMLAKILPALGRFDEALTHLEAARARATTLGDTDQIAWTWIYTGQCRARLGDLDGARSALREAVELWPGYAAYLNLGLECARGGDRDTAAWALTRLEELAASEPSNLTRTAVRHLRGELARQRGELAAAIALLRECPLELDARLALGRCHAAAGDAAAARTQFDFVIEHRFAAMAEGWAATWPLAYFELGRLELSAGREAAGREALDQFLALWGAAPVAEVAEARRLLGAAASQTR